MIILVLFLNTILAEQTNFIANNNHFNYKNVRKLCETKDTICEGGGDKLCAARTAREHTSNLFEYKDFNNSCYLYMWNVCQHYDREFVIVSAGACEQYVALRRHGVVGTDPLVNTAQQNISSLHNNTEYEYYYSDENTTEFQDIKALREESESEEAEAYDGHPCPESCTDAYNPICLSVNRGVGMYFKFYTFVNHCEGDKYYCSHRNEFTPPPDDSTEMVRSSMLSWSYCGSHRYLQFARFAEVASSMGHYGWLKTDERYSKIMASAEHAFDDKQVM